MNFFQQIHTLGQGMDILLRIKGKNGKLTIAVEPQLANISRLKPLVLTGTPSELDEGFIAQFDGLMTAARGLESNLAEVKQDAADLAKNPPKDSGKAKPQEVSPKKPEKNIKTSGKKGKDQPEKKASKPVKEEKTQPTPADMFSQPAPDPEPATPADEEVAPEDAEHGPAQESNDSENE